jgi:hypothetical protein
MPTYTFKLQDGCGGVEDETGVTLPDDDRAIRYAYDVVHELMRCRELETRSWCLDVYEGSKVDIPICEIPFASVDPSLDHLAPKLRTMVEAAAERMGGLREVIHSVRGTVEESRALVARARGKPYLASRFGKSVISDT